MTRNFLHFIEKSKYKMKRLLNNFLQGVAYCLCNYVVSYIPFWNVRKLVYRMLGMKIGKGSRILMRVVVISPSRIVLGERVIINEYCYLDGRGGIEIGNDCSISVYSYINTGQHMINSQDFEYSTKNVTIADHVWICARVNVLGGANLQSGSVICAGSTVIKGDYEKLGIYSGIPASKIGEREEQAIHYKLSEWNPFFR